MEARLYPLSSLCALILPLSIPIPTYYNLQYMTAKRNDLMTAKPTHPPRLAP
jgi:hypothetical protein